MAALQDLTLDELRERIAPRLAEHAAFDGWNRTAVDSVARDLGVDTDVARLAMEGRSIDLIDAWVQSVDRAMAVRCPTERLAAMKIRERIETLILARLEMVAPAREALRRALTILSLPINLGRAARIGWRSADVMWRLAGDISADYNHYTKRAMLASIYSATLLVFVNDESADFADTRAFLDRRIDNVMQIEKAKAGFVARSENRPSLSRFVGRLRYPAR